MEDKTMDLETEDESEKPELQQLKLVALMLNASFQCHRSLEEERNMAGKQRCAYLDYDEARSLLSELQSMAADEGKLNEAACGALHNIAEAQLSFSPIEPDEYRAYLNGLVELADVYGVMLTVIEVKWEFVEDKSEVKVELNDIPRLILPLGDICSTIVTNMPRTRFALITVDV